MATLEKIKQLKSQGFNDREIVTSLQEQGVSPREITDAMAQSKIKAAVADQDFNQGQMTQDMGDESMKGMQSSMLNQSAYEFQQPSEKMTQEIAQPEYSNQYPGNYQEQQNYPAQSYYQEPQQYPSQEQPQEQYSQAGFYPESYGQAYASSSSQYPSYDSASSDAVSEIAEQIVDEKLTQTKSTLQKLNEVTILLTAQIEKIEDRLHRVESIIDQLQTSLMRNPIQRLISILIC